MVKSTSSKQHNAMVTGLFKDRARAECAYRALSERGYGNDDVNVLMSDQTRDQYFSSDAVSETELGSNPPEALAEGLRAVGVFTL